MNVFLKKTTWAAALTTALFLTACGKEAAVAQDKPAVAAATPTAAPAEAAKTFTADDFKTDGITLVEGTDYQKIANPQPVQVAGKSEVLEFFWYGCPHCYRVEPAVQAWKKTLPPDVNFIRAPANWGKPMDEHQKIYYTLNALKKNDEIDSKVFSALNVDGLGLAKPELISEFMVKNGIDKAAWDSAYCSFAVNTEVAKANALFKAYGLQGVPNFIVNGKYVVGGETARTLQIVNKLLEQDRGGKK